MTVKKYYEMAEEDEAEFLRRTEEDTMGLHGVPRKVMKPHILSFPDNAFDDSKMYLLSPNDYLVAVFCRKDFNNKKPEQVDYLLWYTRTQTQSDDIEKFEKREIPDGKD